MSITSLNYTTGPFVSPLMPEPQFLFRKWTAWNPLPKDLHRAAAQQWEQNATLSAIKRGSTRPLKRDPGIDRPSPARVYCSRLVATECMLRKCRHPLTAAP